jgi:DNA repair exonuclease SbcCD nuclease subunit
MSFLIRKIFQKVLSLDALYKKLENIEKRLIKLEDTSDERESLWFFIEEMREQEKEAYKLLQDEFNDAIVRSIEPRGEA